MKCLGQDAGELPEVPLHVRDPGLVPSHPGLRQPLSNVGERLTRLLAPGLRRRALSADQTASRNPPEQDTLAKGATLLALLLDRCHEVDIHHFVGRQGVEPSSLTFIRRVAATGSLGDGPLEGRSASYLERETYHGHDTPWVDVEVAQEGLEPSCSRGATDFKSAASAIPATGPEGTRDRDRTCTSTKGHWGLDPGRLPFRHPSIHRSARAVATDVSVPRAGLGPAASCV